MKIKECKNYFDKVSIMLGTAKKIDKNKSLIFSWSIINNPFYLFIY